MSIPLILAQSNKPLSWRFDQDLEEAYHLIANLRPEEAKARLAHVKDPARKPYRTYLESLSQTIDILVTENEEKFPAIEREFETRLDALEDEPEGPDQLFLLAELNLQLGFCYLNLSRNFNAILAIREAYQLVEKCQTKYPSYIPIRKTSGVIQVMVGAVPDKYHFFMMLLGMEGTVAAGQKQLNELRSANISLSMEASILYFTVKGFVNQQFGEASVGMTDLLKKDPDNRLLMFMAVSMLMKNYQSEEALRLIRKIDQEKSGLPMVYIDYLRAEILLQKGDYPAAIQAYQRFMTAYKGHSFKKDSHFKIALAWQLAGKPEQAKQWWEKARHAGKAVTEPDAHADFILESGRIPNTKLLKVRLLTDGGYFKEARTALDKIEPKDLTDAHDKADHAYRYGRLAQLTGATGEAQSFYLKTIELTGNQPWYIAPSSALQLGYILRDKGEKTTAKKYFEKALSYRRHAYKNSIDGKARSALQLLNQVRN